jgi:hypothetical protein
MNAIFKLLSRISVALFTVFLASAAHADPIINNGGFESGDFSGWTLIGSENNFVATDYVHEGTFTAYFGEPGAAASISQSLATQAGHTYLVKFWLKNFGGMTDNSETANIFEMFVGGDSAFILNNKAPTDYAEFEVQFTAGADDSELMFSFQHDDAFWLLDNVSISEVPEVDPPTSVPEPANVLLFGLALGLLVLNRSRR